MNRFGIATPVSAIGIGDEVLDDDTWREVTALLIGNKGIVLFLDGGDPRGIDHKPTDRVQRAVTGSEN